jgi:hypothetical protein
MLRLGVKRQTSALWWALVRLGILAFISQACHPTSAQTIHVDATPDHSTNTFRPTEALGAAVDRISRDATDKLFTDSTIAAILSAGWQTVTYRQNTELQAEAWHWNPQGSWSEPGNKGYFIGNSRPSTTLIRHSDGYSLPHGGFSYLDSDGYSRLTDGDPNTYWKSNPYLTKTFTGEDDALHPQWVVVDLAKRQKVNSIRIDWAKPYARRYTVQYWTGEDAIRQPAQGSWLAFSGGQVTNGAGGRVTLKLSMIPVSVQFVRVWMTESSNTCDTHDPKDARNCVGYAINELFLGTATVDGAFHDAIRHTADASQTLTVCSSVDPWHETTDVNQVGDQVGFDLFFRSGISRGLPAMVPVSILYDTPDNAAAEITYIERRGYPISYVEMGEEPDGQHILPEDYGALYLQWAAMLHRVDSKLKLGGPVFQGVDEDVLVWPDAAGKASWLGRFLDYIRAHKRLDDLSFFSFEHYPLQACKITWSDLYEEPSLIRRILQVWRDDGLPTGIPVFVTESNVAPEADESMVDIFGALWWADYVGAFLEAGGKGLYYFHYLPEQFYHACEGFSPGTFGMFKVDANYQILQPTSQYFSSQLINLEWVQPGSESHRIYPAKADVVDAVGNVLVTAYAVLRPDGQWALMIVNKDQENAHPVQIVFQNLTIKKDTFFSGTVSVVTFGRQQYRWHSNIAKGIASPDGPLAMSTIAAGKDTVYTLPQASITVLRGTLALQ